VQDFLQRYLAGVQGETVTGNGKVQAGLTQ
jgi:hypothetical protein